MASEGLGSLDGVLDTADDLAPEDLHQDSDILRLKQAFINERTSPDVLCYETELVERVQAQLEYQEQKIANLDPHPDTSLQKCLYLTELARVKYLLRCYYRTRLRKVEAFTMSLLDTADTSDPSGPTHHLLSPKELTYAQEYFVIHAAHMRENVLLHLPEGLEDLTQQSSSGAAKDTFPRPNLDKHIFCRVLEDRGAVDLEGATGTDSAEFEKGDLYIVRYQPVRELLRDKWIAMV